MSTVIDSTSEGSHNKVFTGDVQVNVMVVIGHGLPSLTEKEAEKVSGLRQLSISTLASETTHSYIDKNTLLKLV